MAAKDPAQRFELLRRLAVFVDDYRRALAEWQGGFREAEFPAGTYQMRVLHGAVCASAG